jgi:hypothetical protein
MNDREKEIAEKYLLPERPFLHGMASAFDLFGVLGQGRNEQLLANLQEDFRKRSDMDIMRSAWRTVGESLLYAMDQYDRVAGESSSR